MGQYAKALVALGAFFGVASAALADGAVDGPEIQQLTSSGVGVLLVFAVSNARRSEAPDAED